MKTLISEAEVQAGVQRLATQIRAEYGKQPLTVIGIMTGSLVLLADMIRLLDMPLRVGVVQASSYRGDTQRGELALQLDWMPEIRDHDVLLVDDIFDTGHTLHAMLEHFQRLSPRSVKSAVLLTKQERAEVSVRPDFHVFQIPDRFVVGYGLDYQDLYRHLPYIATLDETDLA